MEKIYSKVDKNRLLHIVVRKDDFKKGRTEIVPEQHFIQCALLDLEKGKTFKPHQHIWKPAPREEIIAQESWVVIQGSVTIHMYDTDGTHIGDEIIEKGDCSMTFEGGHTYTILEEDTVVYEYKTGPYTGIENDKVFIEDHRE